MNVMYYGMVNGYQGYYPSSALTAATPSGPGILGSGATAMGATSALGVSALGASSALATAGAPLANSAAAASLMPKWIMPNFSSTQIQYMFRHRMDKGAKVNKAVKCDTCGITLNSEQQAQQHYSGKNHLKKLKGIGKKKDGKDGEDSDKDSDRRRSRDRRGRRRNKDEEDNDDGSKKGDNDDESLTDKDRKNDESEEGKSKGDDQEKSDSDKDDDSAKDTESISSDISSRNDEDCNEHESVDLERSKVTSPSAQGSDDESSKCQSSSQNQSQILTGEHIKSSNVNDVEMPLSVSDTVGASVKNQNNCDNEPPQPLDSEHKALPNGLIMSAPHRLSPSSRSSVKSPSVMTSDPSEPSDEKMSFKLPNGASLPVLSAAYKSSVDISTDSSHITTPSVTSSPGSRSVTTTSTLSRCLPTMQSPTTSYQSLKRSYSPPRGATSLHSHGSRCSQSGIIPYKKPRSSYLGSSVGGMTSAVDIRASLMASPHLALTPNSIPGFGALQQPMCHLAAEAVSPSSQQLAAAGLRPVMQTRGATTLSTQVPSYRAQYSSVQPYQSAVGQVAQVGQVTQASYPYQYQALASSDLTNISSLQTSLQQGMLNPYYPSGVTTPQIQQSLLAQTGTAPSADLLTSDLLTSDISPYLTSKDLTGQHIAMKYAGSIPTSSGLAGGYQYQAISIQAMNANTPYQGAAMSPFTSTHSPPYLSISGPQNGATAPALPTATAMTPSVPLTTPIMTITHQPNTAGQDGDGSKLDPVAQAVYDNVLGKLPLKRKREIPCTACGLIFNSEAQANAHFAGTKHLKKQKLSDDGEGVATGASSGDVKKSPTAKSGQIKSEGKEEIRCDVCNTAFNNIDQANSHYRGSKHARKLKMTAAKTEDLPEGVSAKCWGAAFDCSICQTTLNSLEQLEAHKMGKQHMNKQNQLNRRKISTTGTVAAGNSFAWNEVAGKEPGWLYCQACDISVRTGMCLKQHVQNQPHKDKVEAGKQKSLDTCTLE